MRVVILGGGFTGLSAAHYLQKKGHSVTLFEKENTLGGLACGFKNENWEWYLEKTYHHWFSNDFSILEFAREIGFKEVVFKTPKTASYYCFNNKPLNIPLNTPVDLIKFPYLKMPDKIKTGLVIAFLKLSSFLSIYEKKTAEEFIKKNMGN